MVEALPVIIRSEVALSQRKLPESMSAPPVVTNGTRPDVKEEMAKFVLVAFVVVAFNPVKFWRVVEAVIERLFAKKL